MLDHCLDLFHKTGTSINHPEFFDISGRIPEKVIQYYQIRIVCDNSGMNVAKNIHEFNISSIIQPHPCFFEYHAGASVSEIEGTMINLPS
jgi:hypothetical protein